MIRILRWHLAVLRARLFVRWRSFVVALRVLVLDREFLSPGWLVYAARIHGRNALVYLQGAGAQAQPFSNAADYDISATFPTVDATALGDDWETKLRGTMSWTGTINGPLDTSVTLPWDALVTSTTVPRNLYLYPDKNNTATYYYGTAFVDVNVKGGVAAAQTFSSKVTGTGQLSTK